MSNVATKVRNPNNNLIQVRVPAGLKKRTAELFERLGTDTSTVIKLMLVQADETQSIPFRVRTESYPISANEVIDEVAATFELEGMPLTEQNIKDLQDIELARITTEDVRQRLLADIKRRHENDG